MATTSETLDTAARIAGTASRRPRSQSTASPISSSLMPSSSTPLRSRRPPTRDTTHPQRRRSYPRRRVLSPLLTITTALGLAIQITAVTAQGGPTADDDPRKLICFFDNHRAIVAGDTLFVDGGEWAPKDTFRDNGTATSVVKWQNEYLWQLPLTTRFNASSPPWALEKKPAAHTAHYNGAESVLWDFGLGGFVSVGGWFSPYHGPPGEIYPPPLFTPVPSTSENDTNIYSWVAPEPRMFSYDVATRGWTGTRLPRGVARVSAASWASSARLRRGWALGGSETVERDAGMRNPDGGTMVDLGTGGYLDTLTEFDYNAAGGEGKWRTTEVPPGIGGTVDGGLVALERVGEQGVLVFLGGEERRRNGTTLELVYKRRPMDTIHIYNIATSTWHTQRTSGAPPPGRRASCTLAVPSPDHTSYQLYLFSGTLPGELHLLDMHVLTLPTFTWLPINLTTAHYPEHLAMSAHQCVLAPDQRQMLIVPGIRNASTDAETFQWGCAPRTGVRVFDTREWVFRGEFDPGLGAAGVPGAVVEVVGGDGGGGATVDGPRGGWEDGVLGRVFAVRNQPVVYPDVTTTNSSSSPTAGVNGPNPAQAENSAAGRLSRGAVAGIVLGSVLGALLLTALILYFFRRRARRGRSPAAAPVELQGATTRGEMGGSAGGYGQRHELGGGYEPQELMGHDQSSGAGAGGWVKKDRDGEGGGEGLEVVGAVGGGDGDGDGDGIKGDGGTAKMGEGGGGGGGEYYGKSLGA